MKIVVLTSRFPYPLEKGDKLRLYHFLKILSKTHDIYLIAIHNKEVSSLHLIEIDKYCRKVEVHVLNHKKRALSIVSWVFKKYPAHIGYFYNESIQQQIKKSIDFINPDVILCHLVRMAPYCYKVNQKVWIDLMDSFSLNLKRRLLVSSWLEKIWLRWEIRRMVTQESIAISKFEKISIISEQDKLSFEVTNTSKIQVIPNGVDISYFKPKSSVVQNIDVSFIGNLGYEPNINAAYFIIQKLAPHLSSDIKWRIGGDRASAKLLKLKTPNILVSGWIKNILEVYQASKIFVAPLFTGSGLQNKILEAMAAGVPVVTTTLVNNAIGAKDGVEIMLANSKDAFLNCISTLLNNEELRMNLANNGRAFILRNYTWEKIEANLNKFLLD